MNAPDKHVELKLKLACYYADQELLIFGSMRKPRGTFGRNELSLLTRQMGNMRSVITTYARSRRAQIQ